jgi:hypothetical protein
VKIKVRPVTKNTLMVKDSKCEGETGLFRGMNKIWI